jgi:hypothetical protein
MVAVDVLTCLPEQVLVILSPELKPAGTFNDSHDPSPFDCERTIRLQGVRRQPFAGAGSQLPTDAARTCTIRIRCGWSPTGNRSISCARGKEITDTLSESLFETKQRLPSPLVVAQ